MVLAAGFGTRLRPLTEERPKPLVEVFGRPLITYNLDHLVRVGVSKAVINTHYLGDALAHALGTDYKGMALEFIHEPEILGTGGGLKNVAHHLEPFDEIFLMNADAFVDIDLQRLVQARTDKNAFSALLLKQVADAKTFGAIGTNEDDEVVSFVDRIPVVIPPSLERMFCGVHLFQKEFLSWVKQGEGTFCINQITYPEILKAGKKVIGVDQPGLFQDVGTPQRLLDLHWAILSGATRLESIDLWESFSVDAAHQQRPQARVFCHPEAHVSADLSNATEVFIDKDTQVSEGACLERKVVLGPRVKVGKGAILSGVVVQSGTEIAAGQVFRDGIVYPGGFIPS